MGNMGNTKLGFGKFPIHSRLYYCVYIALREVQLSARRARRVVDHSHPVWQRKVYPTRFPFRPFSVLNYIEFFYQYCNTLRFQLKTATTEVRFMNWPRRPMAAAADGMAATTRDAAKAHAFLATLLGVNAFKPCQLECLRAILYRRGYWPRRRPFQKCRVSSEAPPVCKGDRRRWAHRQDLWQRLRPVTSGSSSWSRRYNFSPWDHRRQYRRPCCVGAPKRRPGCSVWH